MLRRTWFLVLCALAGTILVLAVGALWVTSQALQHQPITSATPSLAVSDLNAARRLISRETLRGAFHGTPLRLSLTGAQAQALLQDASTRLLHAPSSLTLSAQQAEITLSLPIQQTPLRALAPLGTWLNVRARLTAPRQGAPVLSAVTLGALRIPPSVALWAGRRVARSYGLLELAELGLAALESVRLAPQRVALTARWRPELSAQASAMLLPPDMLEAMTRAHHLFAERLNQRDAHGHQPPHLPLSEVLPPMMASAQQRSLSAALSADSARLSEHAARENRAVLLVLGLYVNHVSLASVVPEASQWPPLPTRTLTLHGREDLAQHFLTSAAMATDLGGRLSDLIGVYKEMLDASPQGHGSGFSFNDLAADKAGVRLGRLGMKEPVEAQLRLASAQAESDFMPEVQDLPEFMSEKVFRQRFGGLDAPAYEAMMRDIERRVAATPALR